MRYIYVSGIAGLQRQVLQNVVIGIAATVRGLGVVGVLAWVSPTVKAFFLWQGLISLITVGVLAGLVYHALPSARVRGRFSGAAMLGIWRFAAGMMTITILSLLLTQVDKILLSRLLTLESFARYALGGVVANGLYLLAGPITGALYPRFTQLATNGDEAALSALYHEGAQLVTVVMGAAAIMLMVCGERVLRVWTGNPALARQVAPLLAVLALGTFFNGLMWIPYQMMLAHGWTSLTIRVNTVAVCLLVPAIFWVVPAYGAIGAARVWVVLNAGYLLFAIPLMHRRLLLPADKWRWYRQDVAVPLVAATAAALLCRWTMPHAMGKLGETLALLITAGTVLLTAAMTAPLVRDRLARYLRELRGPSAVKNEGGFRMSRPPSRRLPGNTKFFAQRTTSYEGNRAAVAKSEGQHRHGCLQRRKVHPRGAGLARMTEPLHTASSIEARRRRAHARKDRPRIEVSTAPLHRFLAQGLGSLSVPPAP